MSALVCLFPRVLATPATAQSLPTSQRIRAASLRARRTLVLSARATEAGSVLSALHTDEEGAPIPSNGWHWSIAHDSELAGGVVSRLPVGFDLERARPMRAELVAGFLDAREQSLLDPEDVLDLARAWTAKEAVLKRARTGLTALSDCRLLAPLEPDRAWLGFRGERCLVVHARHREHVLAIHAEGERWEVVWPTVRSSLVVEDPA